MSSVKTVPIIAIATGTGNAGIGIIRISGSDEDISALYRKLFPGKDLRPRYAELLPIHDKNGEVLDRGIVLYFRAPFSYTGESVLELQVHGGRTLLALLQQELLLEGRFVGLRPATPGEFTERAFLNGKVDLVQAEAIADLIDANSRSAARAAARSLKGDFSKAVNGLNESLINLRVEVEAILDFPEEEIDFISEYKSKEKLEAILTNLTNIINNARQGEVLRDGLRVALIGETNVGKSSLLNYLAGEEVAIVSDIAGTTRDKIQTDITLSGIPFHFVDTAGIRETTDSVEQIGIQKTREEISKADIILQIKDASRGSDESDALLNYILNTVKKEAVPVISVLNKIDLVDPLDINVDVSRGTVLKTSTLTGEGMPQLREKLIELAGVTDAPSVYMARERHIKNLKDVEAALLRAKSYLESNNPQIELFAEELRLSSEELGEITGKFTSDDLLGKIFAGFCIGK